MDSVDPYKPPLTPIELLDTGPVALDLASRGSRLLARLVDLATQILAFLPGLVLALAALNNGQRLPDDTLMRSSLVVTAVLVVALLGVNCYLLARAGQTLGKRALGIRIVATDGERVSLLRLLVLRIGPMFLLELIPSGMGPVLGLGNALLIFGEERRCLHDRLAGTTVVRT